MIISRTPFRISFFGGGTDYPTWYQEHGGMVLATTIDKYCYISGRYLPPFFEHKYRIVYSLIENVKNISEIKHPSVKAVLDWMSCTKGLEIHHDGDLPARSGLGSSSSFTVGLLNVLKAMNGQYITQQELASQAIHVEQNIIRENVGSQDQISAAFGGFNRIEFKTDGSFDVVPVILPKEKMERLEEHCLLYFTGVSRFSSEIAQSKIANFKNRMSELKTMKSMVDEAISILHSEHSSVTDFGTLLHQNWLYKRTLSDKVSTPLIDQIYEDAIKAGALGGKILGAGGGGFLLLFVRPEQQDKVKEKLKNFIHVPFKFEHSGSKIVLYQPNGF